MVLCCMMLRGAVITLIALALVTLQHVFFVDQAWAHSMHLQEEKPGMLRATYEGGRPAPKSVITLLGEEEQVLLTGPVDEQGRFTFDHKALKPIKAVARDGLGHRDILEFAATEDIAETPLILRVAFGLALLLIPAIYFYYRTKRNQPS